MTVEEKIMLVRTCLSCLDFKIFLCVCCQFIYHKFGICHGSDCIGDGNRSGLPLTLVHFSRQLASIVTEVGVLELAVSQNCHGSECTGVGYQPGLSRKWVFSCPDSS